MSLTQQACDIIDTLLDGERFKQETILSAVPGSSAVVPQLIRRLLRLGAVEIVDRRKPFTYVRLKSIMDLQNSGELKLSSGGRSAAKEQTVSIEIDPLDFFEQIPPDDFGRLVSIYLKNRDALLEPLRLRMTELHQRVTMLTNERDAIQRRTDSDLASVRHELALARQRIDDLTTELSGERQKRIVREAPIKTLIVERHYPRPDREHNNDSREQFKPIVVHRKTR